MRQTFLRNTDLAKQITVFTELYEDVPAITDAEALNTKWQRILAIRALLNKELENKRSEGLIGASLQAEVDITANAHDYAVLSSLGDDLRFAFMVSKVTLAQGDTTEPQFVIHVSTHEKCDRCWHYTDDVGSNPEHPHICGRCDSNLHGDGEARQYA